MPSSDKLASEEGDGGRRQKAANRLYMESGITPRTISYCIYSLAHDPWLAVDEEWKIELSSTTQATYRYGFYDSAQPARSPSMSHDWT